MADVTVKQLAQVVGIPVERLLTQLQEAGLSINDENQLVKEDQKRVLLAYLKSGSSAGATRAVPDRITLRRKSVSQVTLGHDAHSGKTVNIEVRTKRVYVKREPVPVELPEPEINEVVAEPELPVVVPVEENVAIEPPLADTTIVASEEPVEIDEVI